MKVQVSPKATKMELSITPSGGTTKPAIKSPAPIIVNIAAIINLRLRCVAVVIILNT